MFKDSPRK